MDNNFAVATSAEYVAVAAQFVTQGGRVIHFAVVAEPERTVLVRQGHVPAGDVDDAEPLRREANGRHDVEAVIVRPAVC